MQSQMTKRAPERGWQQRGARERERMLSTADEPMEASGAAAAAGAQNAREGGQEEKHGHGGSGARGQSVER